MIKYVCLITSILFALGLNAQTPNEILAGELTDFIQSQMTQQSIPGLSACIVKGNEVVWKDAYGMANISTSTPVTVNTEFTLASISKLFTATACVQLAEAGVLDLDADINDYLPITIINPNFPNIPITTRQLLQHKSSLHDSESDLQLWDAPGDPIYNLGSFCEKYFVPGGDLYVASNWGNTSPDNSAYWYSNAGFTLLGYIVEEASNMPFNDFCRENILTPLQMNDAHWFLSNTNIDDLAMPYNANLQPYGYYSVPEYPAAMLKANVAELANFLITYTQRGIFNGNTIVNEASFNMLVPETMTNGLAWWGTDTWWGDPQGNFWSHGGYMNGVRTQLNYYPVDSTGLIILTNGEGNYTAIQNKLEEYIPLFETDVISGIPEKMHLGLDVFPNPVSLKERLIIQFGAQEKDNKKLTLYDLNGRLVWSLETKDTLVHVNFEEIEKGMYLLKVVKKGSSEIRKIFIY